MKTEFDEQLVVLLGTKEEWELKMKSKPREGKKVETKQKKIAVVSTNDEVGNKSEKKSS